MSQIALTFTYINPSKWSNILLPFFYPSLFWSCRMRANELQKRQLTLCQSGRKSKELTYIGALPHFEGHVFLEILLQSFTVCFSKPQRAYTESFIRDLSLFLYSMIGKKARRCWWLSGYVLFFNAYTYHYCCCECVTFFANSVDAEPSPRKEVRASSQCYFKLWHP